MKYRFGGFFNSGNTRLQKKPTSPIGSQIQEVGDYEAQNWLSALILIRSKMIHIATETPVVYL
jgi:hypothetical protein